MLWYKVNIINFKKKEGNMEYFKYILKITGIILRILHYLKLIKILLFLLIKFYLFYY